MCLFWPTAVKTIDASPVEQQMHHATYTRDAGQDTLLYTHLSDLKKTTRVTHYQVPIDDDCMLGGAVISAWVLYKPTTRLEDA